jgi:NADPH:quinone reductase
MYRRMNSPAMRTNCVSTLISGRVSPHVCAVYPLADTVVALKHVADGRAIGKVLIDLS